MDKSIHFILQSLKDSLYRCEENENDLNSEVRMWRKRYCVQELFDDSELVRQSFLAVPTSRFSLDSPEEIVENLRKIAGE